MNLTDRKRIAQIILACLAAAGTGFALLGRFSEISHAFLPEPVTPALAAAVFLCLLAFYLGWIFCCQEKQIRPVSWTAVFFSLFSAIASFVGADLNTLETVWLSVFLLRFAGFLLFWLCALSWMHTFSFRSRGKGVFAGKREARLFYLAVIGVCWIPYIIAFFPGSLAYDTAKSIASWNDPSLGRNNPWFLNVLYGGVIHLGDLLGNADIPLFLFCMVQAAAFAWAVADLLALLRERHTPKGLLAGLALFYGILPIFPAYAFCMGKDSSLALCVLLFGRAGLYLIHDSGSDASSRLGTWVQLAVFGILTALCRNGAFIMILGAIIGFFVLFRQRRIFLAVTAAVLLLVQFLIPGWLGVPSTAVKESLSLPIQQIAHIATVYQKELTKAEKDELRTIMAPSTWRKYQPGIADPVKKKIKDDPEPEYWNHLFTLWKDQVGKRPYAALDAAILMNYGYYVPQADRSDLKARLFMGMEHFPYSTIQENTTLSRNKNPGIETIQQFYDALNGTPVVRLTLRIGLYSWILFAAWFACRGKKRRLRLILLPLMGIFVGCCFSPVNGYLRYAFPIMVCIPVFGLFCFQKEKQERIR